VGSGNSCANTCGAWGCNQQQGKIFIARTEVILVGWVGLICLLIHLCIYLLDSKALPLKIWNLSSHLLGIRLLKPKFIRITLKNSRLASKKTQSISSSKISWLMLFNGIIVVTVRIV
jgi:hypothetical protein